MSELVCTTRRALREQEKARQSRGDRSIGLDRAASSPDVQLARSARRVAGHTLGSAVGTSAPGSVLTGEGSASLVPELSAFYADQSTGLGRSDLRKKRRHKKRRSRLGVVAAVAGVTGTLFSVLALPANAAPAEPRPVPAGQDLPTQKLLASGSNSKRVEEAYTAARVGTVGRARLGPSVGQLLANPPSPGSYSLSEVFSLALTYRGTPYAFGGASPAGFDCSGFIRYVFAHFGINLPHSVSGQAAAGQRISIKDARPGDLVIMNGHDGFYAGDGKILHAPDYGRTVSLASIWTNDYYIVRIGI